MGGPVVCVDMAHWRTALKLSFHKMLMLWCAQRSENNVTKHIKVCGTDSYEDFIDLVRPLFLSDCYV